MPNNGMTDIERTRKRSTRFECSRPGDAGGCMGDCDECVSVRKEDSNGC
jgi:hypothetical protein